MTGVQTCALPILNGLITDSDMAEMNDSVETENKEARDVAEEFLRSHDLLQ